VARDRIEGVLQAILHVKEALGLTEDFAPNSG
jgi:hypothetical protein